MKARILTVYESKYLPENFEYEEYLYKKEDLSSWEDVTKEELIYLRQWIQQKNAEYGWKSNKKYLLITEEDIDPVIDCKTLSDFINLAKAEEKKNLEKEKKRKEAAKKAAETRKKKKEEEKRKQYEELKHQFENKK